MASCSQGLPGPPGEKGETGDVGQMVSGALAGRGPQRGWCLEGGPPFPWAQQLPSSRAHQVPPAPEDPLELQARTGRKDPPAE